MKNRFIKTCCLLLIPNFLLAFQIAPKEKANNTSLILSISILSFGFLLILAILIFLYKMNKGFGNLTFKTLGIVLILTASLFLIVAGYSQDQITPVIGLLGTVAGFIFGSNIDNRANSGNTRNGSEGK